MPTPPPGSTPDAAMLDEVRRVLDLIRPAVQSDGGDVELVEITPEGIVKVRLHGACVGCPESTQTLHHLLEKSLRQRIAGVRGVAAVA